jgi:hypothetical protein
MKWLLQFVAVVAVLFSGVVSAAKPPPPPPPPPTGCVGATAFPSIVFGKLAPANGSSSTWDIYVGNGAGTCAVKVYSIAGTSANNVSMAFDGSQYKVVWVQSERQSKNGPLHAVVKMVRFHVGTQLITDPLPLTATTLWTDQLDTTAAYFYDVNISSGASTVVFTRRVSTQIELNLLDVSTCMSACQPLVAFTDSPYEGVSGAVFGPGAANRIYFTAKQTGQAWGLYFVDKVNGAWVSPPRLVATMADTVYADPTRKIFWPRTTRLDYDGVGGANDLVSFSAYTRDSGGASVKGVDILDVTNCASSGTGTGGITGSCIENNEAFVLRHNIPGDEGSGGWKGDGSILTMNYTGALNGDVQAIFPFTSQAPVDHGPGVMPDGIK